MVILWIYAKNWKVSIFNENLKWRRLVLENKIVMYFFNLRKGIKNSSLNYTGGADVYEITLWFVAPHGHNTSLQ